MPSNLSRGMSPSHITDYSSPFTDYSSLITHHPSLITHHSVVCIIGLGYVGLPLAKAFSKSIKVIGFDTDTQRLNQLISQQSAVTPKTPASRLSTRDSKLSTPASRLSTNRVDCVILAVAHDFFKKITLDTLKAIMNTNPILIDIRGIFDAREARLGGFYYETL